MASDKKIVASPTIAPYKKTSQPTTSDKKTSHTAAFDVNTSHSSLFISKSNVNVNCSKVLGS